MLDPPAAAVGELLVVGVGWLGGEVRCAGLPLVGEPLVEGRLGGEVRSVLAPDREPLVEGRLGGEVRVARVRPSDGAG